MGTEEEGGAREPRRYMDRALFEELYQRLNHKEWVDPDPLVFLYDYQDIRDREIVGLIASSLAYGRVKQILESVRKVLQRLPHPREDLLNSDRKELEKRFEGFRHRFTTGRAMAWMLSGVAEAIRDDGSIENFFLQGLDPDDEDIVPALKKFVDRIGRGVESSGHWILSSPGKGSACKRLNLFLRWMVRKDEVDPGGWDRVPRSKLIVPVDTHMNRLAKVLGFSSRKQADLKTAREITRTFRSICSEDPVKYDFALTRIGIRSDFDFESFLCKYLRE